MSKFADRLDELIENLDDIDDSYLEKFLFNHAPAIRDLVRAAENLRDVKGRHHTEIATTRLFEALAKLEEA